MPISFMFQHHCRRYRSRALLPMGLLWFLPWFLLWFLLLFHMPASAAIDPGAAPADFVQAVGSNALEIVKQEQDTIRSGDLDAINAIVDVHVLPYVNLEKTTRLAAGRHWREASPAQREKLVDAFTGTLVRTYSSAFRRVDSKSRLEILPFRGDANASDVVVRSLLHQSDAPPVAIDYRLEKTAGGWKIYDLNVEGIWLIQNYRNQFAQQISQNGIDGLIDALNQRNH